MQTKAVKNQIARINRKLKKRYMKVCASSPRCFSTLGDFYLLDTYQNFILDYHLNLDQTEENLGNIE